MFYTGFLKRSVPFFLTFAAGLFIASFFVSIAAPNFNLRKNRANKTHDCKRVNKELKQLRDDNLRLTAEIEQMQREAVDREALYDAPLMLDLNVPPPTYKGRAYGSGSGSGSGR